MLKCAPAAMPRPGSSAGATKAACCAGLSATRSTRGRTGDSRARLRGEAQRAEPGVVGRLALVVAIAVREVGLDAGCGGVSHQLVDASAKHRLQVARVDALVLRQFAAIGETVPAPTDPGRR